MTNILSQSEVAAIRERAAKNFVQYRPTMIKLCDTVDALRAKLEVAKEIVTKAYEFVAGDGASVDLKRAQVFLASLKEPQ